MALELREKYFSYRRQLREEFYGHIEPLLENEEVQQLDSYIQHYCFTRLRHSMDVAYFSFFVSRLLGWDARSAARGGLLHDLFLYDWRDEDFSGKHHAVNHPKVALENARRICELNKVEENIIRRHMWLLTPVPPRYKEGFVVTFVDKYCALRELCISFFIARRRRLALASADR